MFPRFTTNFTRWFPALTSRDYRLFIVGQFISVIGTWMQNTTQSYLAYRISGKPLDLGVIGFASTLPTLLLALPAGVFVERWDKRKTVIIFQAIMSVQAFGLAALTYSGHIQVWHITVLAFLFGVASAVEITARQAMLVELTGHEALPNAIALQSTAFNIGRVIGPLTASWLLTSTGTEATVFLANGISFIFVIVGLLFARTPYKVEHENTGTRDIKAEFQEGLSYIYKNTLVSSIILMAAIIGFFAFPLIQQIPALARDILATIGDTEAIIAQRTNALYAAQGVGAMTAAFLAAVFLGSSYRKGQWVVWGQVAFILPLIGLGFTKSLNASMVILIFLGWGAVTQLITMNTLIQLKVPNGLRGRVFSIYLWALQGVAPLGSLLIGGIAQNWGVPLSALIGGSLSLVLIGYLHLINPNVRQTQA